MNAKAIVLATIVLLGATVPLTARQAQATAGSKKTAPRVY